MIEIPPRSFSTIFDHIRDQKPNKLHKEECAYYSTPRTKYPMQTRAFEDAIQVIKNKLDLTPPHFEQDLKDTLKGELWHLKYAKGQLNHLNISANIF